MRSHSRSPLELRPVVLTPSISLHAEGSVQVEFGNTKVLVTCSAEERVPPHLVGKGQGWVTAEYGMLPRSTHSRSPREATRGRQGGRTMEIQRLIGRSMRAALDTAQLGPRTLTLDCDVLQADAAVSVGIVRGEVFVDLDYAEDSTAEVDMNIIATREGQLVEIQGTAEHKWFGRNQLDAMLNAGLAAIAQLIEMQQRVLQA